MNMQRMPANKIEIASWKTKMKVFRKVKLKRIKIRKTLQATPLTSLLVPHCHWTTTDKHHKQDADGTSMPRFTGWLTRYIPGDVYTDGTHTKQPQQI